MQLFLLHTQRHELEFTQGTAFWILDLGSSNPNQDIDSEAHHDPSIYLGFGNQEL